MILSVIVPVYNTEAYLEKCVNSLLDQDLPKEDYEIILIDDGSTDSSGSLCDVFVSAHDNIRVIHQPNRGLSAARNTGIALAKGKYIQFVDSDDYLNPNVLHGIVLALESKNLDILRINYQNVNSAGEVIEPNKHKKPFVDYSECICDGLTFLNERLGYACYAVQFVIRASILQREGNFFKEGIVYEDVEWTPRILLQVRRIASSPTMVYNYLLRQDSISRNINLEKRRKALSDRFSILSDLSSCKSGVNDSRWFEGMIAQISLGIIMETSRYFYSERGRIFNSLKEKQVFPLSYYHSTSTAKKKLFLANLSPYLLCALLNWNK